MGDAQPINPADRPPPDAHAGREAAVGSADRQLVHAGVVADARTVHAPGAVLLERGRVVATGAPESLGPPGEGVMRIERLQSMICPPFVNAHAHLDLSDMTAPERGGSFDSWLNAVRAHRHAQDLPGAVERAVSLGAEASLAGGCPFIGDICGSERAWAALRATRLTGVGFVEVIGHDPRSKEGIDRIRRLDAGHDPTGRMEFGVSPHAPYSTGEALYRAAADSSRRVATHLSESRDELEWCSEGTGRFRAMLERIGYPDGAVPHPARHPVDAVLDLLPGTRSVAVHLNHVEERHLVLLAAHGASVVYCPRASRYLGHVGDGVHVHAWRDMVSHGIPVSLGTDGRPCLPGPGVRGTRLSVLDDALVLVREDGAGVSEWLPMATVNAARAIGLHPDEVTLVPGAKSGLLSIPLVDVRECRPDPEGVIEWLFRDLSRVPRRCLPT